VAGVSTSLAAGPSAGLRFATVTCFAHHGDRPARRDALRSGLQALDADLLALQGCVADDRYDQVVELSGAECTVVHQTVGAFGNGPHYGACVVGRLPVRAVYEVRLDLVTRAVEMPGTAAAGWTPR
jgi:hypothetical protein